MQKINKTKQMLEGLGMACRTRLRTEILSQYLLTFSKPLHDI